MMPLTGDKVLLRTTRTDDLDRILDWENRPELQHLGVERRPLSKAEIQAFLDRATNDIYLDGQLRLMIDTLQGKTVGCIDLFEFDQHNQRAGVGILIADTEHRNHGFGNEALKLISGYAFEALNLQQLYCHVPVDNPASLRLFTGAGFTETGRCKDWVRKGPVFVDAVFLQRFGNKTLS